MRTTRFLIAAAITLFVLPAAHAQTASPAPSLHTAGIPNGSGMNANEPEARTLQNDAAEEECDGSRFERGPCEMKKILKEVEDAFGKLPSPTETVTRIEGTFDKIIDRLPDTGEVVTTVAGQMELSDARLQQAAEAAGRYARLPCPAAGTTLPGFGRVGDIRTARHFAGTIGFAGNTIQDVTPSDVLTSANLQAAAVVANFPVQWLSRCLENSWNEEHDAAERDHHTFVKTTLDVNASTRASQANVDQTQAAVADVSTDVAKVEAKLDRLDPALDDVEATTARIIRNADRLETTTLRHDATVDRIETKADRLKAQQGDATELLARMQEAQLRMLIEADLVRQSNTRIALFQLPRSIGGYLELARSIVEETLRRRGAAGIDVRSALVRLDDGVRHYANHDYKRAYSSFREAYQKAVN